MKKIALSVMAIVTIVSTASIAGGFTLAPDGSYVAGDSASLAPDGSYVSGGSSSLTPNGIPSKPVSFSPDASFLS